MKGNELTTGIADCFSICVPAPERSGIRLAIGAGDRGTAGASIIVEGRIDIRLVVVLVDADQSWVELLLRMRRV